MGVPPSQVRMRGYPLPRLGWRSTFVQVPGQDRGVLSSWPGKGVPPILMWEGTPTLWCQKGYPCPDLGRGYPHWEGWGTPLSGRKGTPVSWMRIPPPPPHKCEQTDIHKYKNYLSLVLCMRAVKIIHISIPKESLPVKLKLYLFYPWVTGFFYHKNNRGVWFA